MPPYTTPDGRNASLGSGEVWFDRFDASGVSTGLRHMGMVSKCDITPNVTTQELQNSMSGARETYASAITDLKMDVGVTFHEFVQENMALALLGVAAVFTQSAATKTGATLGTVVTPGNALDTGFLNITVTALKNGATTYVLGTDYTVDSASGMITILAGGAIVAATALTWDGSVPAIASYQTQALSAGNIRGRLRFRSAADAAGIRKVVDIWNVLITPSGAQALIDTAFGAGQLTGKVLPDSTKPLGQRYYREIYL